MLKTVEHKLLKSLVPEIGYKLVKRLSPEALEEDVNRLLQDRRELQGAPLFAALDRGGWIVQAMTRRK